MSVFINLNDENLLKNSSNKAAVHYMPCKIKSNGSAPVSKYFEAGIRSTDDIEVLEASFRGRPLYGKNIKLPENHTGYILVEKTETLSESDRTLYIENKFDNIQYWNYDKRPTTSDRIVSAVNWLNISKAIHSPIQE